MDANSYARLLKTSSLINCRFNARIIAVVAMLTLATSSLATADERQATGPSLYFETDIRPLLKAHCFHCHGEDGHKEAGLDLRLVRLMQQGGDSGSAMHPSQANESLVLQRVEANEMPPAGKSLNDAEKKLLRRWIEVGAPTKRPEPEQPTQEQWTEEERNYWAFQPVVRPEPPTPGSLAEPSLTSASAPRSSIDLFLLHTLQNQGLLFNSPAAPETLIRRLSFDLLGVPPTPEDVLQFASDASPDAYERLVDRLLADPRYGERWGRHWLDVAGYADSDGYTEKDAQRPWAFHYRDYVIRAHNEDRPIDRFITEQLAGDELVPQPWEDLAAEQAELLAATGFLRTAPDGTGQEGVDNNVARNDVVAETIKIFSSSMLGMTIGCAQCHDHRYDPISQKDYFRFRAIFEPGLDWKQWRDRSSRLVSLWSAEQRQLAADVDKEQAELEGKRVAELDTIVDDIFAKEVEKLPEEKRAAARQARAATADTRTSDQQQLLKDFPSLKVDRGSAYLYDGKRINEFNKKYDDLKAGIKTRRPADNFLAVFSETPNQAPVTYVFFRGDFNQPRDAVKPGGLSVLNEHDNIADDDPDLPTTGRRLALARRLTSGTHPLVTRTVVNRIWMHHFGKGLVASPGDFGVLGERPTHPELLDWLASELVSSGWSRKHITRLIVTSAAYRQSSHRTQQHQQFDPENRWLGRMPVRRLEAEVIRDAMLQTSGMIDNTMLGPAAAVNPDEVGQFIIGKATRDGNGILVAKHEETSEAYRRTIYAEVRRSMPLGMLEPFDPATLAPNCDRRSNSTVSTQSLLLMNNSNVIRLAEHFAQRIQREAGDEPLAQVRHAWTLAFGSPPDELQCKTAANWLVAQRAALTKSNEADRSTDAAEAKGTLEKPLAEQQALSLYCQAIFSSNPFLYVD
jgi:mono/diheme cytochrome c family protein